MDNEKSKHSICTLANLRSQHAITKHIVPAHPHFNAAAQQLLYAKYLRFREAAGHVLLQFACVREQSQEVQSRFRRYVFSRMLSKV
jgi:hypothetical protein